MGNNIIGGNIILYKQCFLLSNLDSTSLGTGSMIISGGSSVSGNCHIGGNTIIYGAYGGNTSLGITFPSITTPLITLFPKSTITDTLILQDDNTGLTKTSIISSQTGILSYQNGTYYINTGVIQYSTFYGYNALIPSITNNEPWISSYTYNNLDGTPINTTLKTIYKNNAGISFEVIGDWLQYGLPYQMILSSYFLKLKNTNLLATKLETTPSTWLLVGSIDNNTWKLIHNVSNYLITDNVTITLNETRPFSYFRLIINKVIPKPLESGVQVPGIFNITYSGLPYISPIPPISTINTIPSSSGITTNSNQEIIIPTSINTNSFIGANTFAGLSTLINFGDSTTYGNYNLFRNLTIFGNINTAREDYNLSMNTNILLYGNIDIKQNSFIRGQSTIYGEVYLKENVFIDKNVTIVGNILVSNNAIFSNNFTISDTGITTISNNVNISGITTITNNVNISGITTFTNNIVVNNITTSGIAIFNGSLTCNSLSPILSNATNSNISSSLFSVITKQYLDLIIDTEIVNRNTTLTNTIIQLDAVTVTSLPSRFNSLIAQYVFPSTVLSPFNLFYGSKTGQNNTLGSQNTGFGLNVLLKNTVGNHNTGFGLNAILNNISGSYNTAFGDGALYSSTGDYNTSVGHLNMFSLQGGTLNTGIGYNSGQGFNNGDCNTFLGSNTIAIMNNLSNSTAIGCNSKITSSNQIVIGTIQESTVIAGGVSIGYNSVNTSYNILLNGSGVINAISFNATSDYRIKENIYSLDDTFTIDLLRPVSYINKITGKKDIGLIAHELKDQYSYLVDGEKDEKTYQSINYIGIIGILINEIQILKKKVDILSSM